MTTSTVTARRKGDPRHYVEGKISKRASKSIAFPLLGGKLPLRKSFFLEGLLGLERVDEPEKQGRMKEEVARLMLEKGHRKNSQTDAKPKQNRFPKYIQNDAKEPKGSQRNAPKKTREMERGMQKRKRQK